MGRKQKPPATPPKTAPGEAGADLVGWLHAQEFDPSQARNFARLVRKIRRSARPAPDLCAMASKRIEKPGAGQKLESLVQWGCDRERLLRLVGTLCWVVRKPHPRGLVLGLPRRRLRAVIRRLRGCATDLRTLERDGWLLVVGSLNPGLLGPSFLQHVDSIPRWLEGCAHVAELRLADRRGPLSPKRRELDNIALVHLMTYVREATGSFHDAEVAALVGAALDEDPNHPYTAGALKQWRHENAKKFSRVASTLLMFHPPRPR